MVITPFVITSRGTGVSRWHPRCLSILSLSLSLSLDEQRASNFIRRFVRHTSQNLFLPPFRSSSTFIDEILWHLATCPSSELRARRRGRPHVTSGYSRVKSGMCFGRAHSRLSHASTHAPFIIGTASKRMPKAAKFCCVYTYLTCSTTSTNACAVISYHEFCSFFPNYREKSINVFQRRPRRRFSA